MRSSVPKRGSVGSVIHHHSNFDVNRDPTLPRFGTDLMPQRSKVLTESPRLVNWSPRSVPAKKQVHTNGPLFDRLDLNYPLTYKASVFALQPIPHN
jgi:hypothetical protein